MVQAEPAIEQLTRLKAELEQVKRKRDEFREFVEEIANQQIPSPDSEPGGFMELQKEEAQDLLKGKQ